MSITELRAYVASNDYGAELALQHAMRLLAGMDQERALADRLAAYLEALQYQYAPIVAQRGVAAWKDARKQSTASVVPTNSAETTQDLDAIP